MTLWLALTVRPFRCSGTSHWRARGSRSTWPTDRKHLETSRAVGSSLRSLLQVEMSTETSRLDARGNSNTEQFPSKSFRNVNAHFESARRDVAPAAETASSYRTRRPSVVRALTR